MNIKIANRKNVSTMLIEADFDQIITENFNEIVKALAQRLKVLTELEKVQRQSFIEVDKLISVIRHCSGKNEAMTTISKEFNISRNAAMFLLNLDLTEIGEMLNPNTLADLLKQNKNTINLLLK